MTVEWKVPTAEDAEAVFADKKSNSEIFKAFVISASTEAIEGWADGVDAETVVQTPGLFSLVGDAAKAIVDSCFLTPAGKN